jgi:hypothetical protein
VPGQIVARVEFYCLVGAILDVTGCLYLFLNAQERKHLSVSDRDGEPRLGIVWRKCRRSLCIIQGHTAKSEFLIACRGVSHEVPILPRDAQEHTHVSGLQLFRRQIKLKGFGGPKFYVKRYRLSL